MLGAVLADVFGNQQVHAGAGGRGGEEIQPDLTGSHRIYLDRDELQAMEQYIAALQTSRTAHTRSPPHPPPPTHTSHVKGPEAGGGGGGDERGQSSRIKTKRSCIQELMLRVLDKSAYTRCVFIFRYVRIRGEEREGWRLVGEDENGVTSGLMLTIRHISPRMDHRDAKAWRCTKARCCTKTRCCTKARCCTRV